MRKRAKGVMEIAIIFRRFRVRDRVAVRACDRMRAQPHHMGGAVHSEALGSLACEEVAQRLAGRIPGTPLRYAPGRSAADPGDPSPAQEKKFPNEPNSPL